MTRWPSTWLVALQRSRSASSMQSPPASIAWTRVNSLRPGRYAPARSPRSISASAACSIRAARQGGSQQQAGVGDGVGVVEADAELVQVWEDPIEIVPSFPGITAAVAGAVLPGQRAFLVVGPAPHAGLAVGTC
jgi:hypothetical protein